MESTAKLHAYWQLSNSGKTYTKKYVPHVIAVVANYRSSNNRVQWLVKDHITKRELSGYASSVYTAMEATQEPLKAFLRNSP